MKKKIRKFENHSILTRRLYLLFSLICLLLVLVPDLAIYESLTKPTIRINWQKLRKRRSNKGYCGARIYDASGKPLVENVGKQVWLLRGIVKWQPKIRETAGKLLQYVDVENPQVTERQEVDYYLANTKVIRKRSWSTWEKEIWYRWQRLPEAKIYQAAVDSIDPSKLGFLQMMRKRSFISIARWMRWRILHDGNRLLRRKR